MRMFFVFVLVGFLNIGAAYAADESPVSAAAATTSTTTLERTTTKSYTVTTRRVGLIGNRPYPVHTQTYEGGVVLEKYMDGTPQSIQIVEPDQAGPALEGKSGQAHDYFTGADGARLYGADPLNLRIHNQGRFND